MSRSRLTSRAAKGQQMFARPFHQFVLPEVEAVAGGVAHALIVVYHQPAVVGDPVVEHRALDAPAFSRMFASLDLRKPSAHEALGLGLAFAAEAQLLEG